MTPVASFTESANRPAAAALCERRMYARSTTLSANTVASAGTVGTPKRSSGPSDSCPGRSPIRPRSIHHSPSSTTAEAT